MLSFGKKSAPINTDKIDTLIGKNTDIQGGLQAEGTVRVDGKVKGDVTLSGNLVIGEQAFIKGNIKADNVHMAGVVEGNITATNQLHMTPTGKLRGDMNVKNIVIDEGATFQGSCVMAASEAAATKAGAKGTK